MSKETYYKRDTTNMRYAQIASAKSRQCPSCGRKSALFKVADCVGFHVRKCRWCGYLLKYGENTQD